MSGRPGSWIWFTFCCVEITTGSQEAQPSGRYTSKDAAYQATGSLTMNQFRHALQRFREGSAVEDGMTLIEIMIAIFILAVAILAVATTAVSSLTTMRISRERQHATAAVTGAIEEIRSYDFRDIAIDDGELAELGGDVFVTTGDCPQPTNDPAALCFDHDDDALNPEEMVTSTTGGVVDYKTVEVDGRLTVRRFVTWLNRDPTTVSKQDAKRVTVIATFEDSGSSRTVRESTVVAQADRGLPVPKFDIAPTTLVEPREDGLACFAHLLRNLGAEDAYDWQLFKAKKESDGSYTLQDSAGPSDGKTFTARGWSAEAWFDSADYAPGSPPTPNASPNIWTDTTGDAKPDSPWRVETGDFQSVTFCYRSTNSSASEHNIRTFAVTVRSAFDSTVDETLFHEIAPDASLATAYLHHEPPNNGDGTDVCSSLDRTLTTPPQVYDADTTVPAQLCGGTSQDFLYDYDQNLDPSGLPGLYLKRGDANYQAVWQFQPGDALDIANVNLIIHSGWAGAFTGSTSTPELRYEVRLEEVTSSATNTLVSTTISYVHDVAGWKQVSVPFDIPDTEIGPTEFLQLRMWCVSQNDACHLGYDTNTYRSRLELGLVAP